MQNASPVLWWLYYRKMGKDFSEVKVLREVRISADLRFPVIGTSLLPIRPEKLLKKARNISEQSIRPFLKRML